MFAPCKGIAFSGIREIFASGIRNPGLWNLDKSSRKPESNWRLEFGIQVPLTKTMDSNTWNPNPRWGIIQNPRLPWIPLHGAIRCVKRRIVDRSVLPWRNAALVTQKKNPKEEIAEQKSATRQGCLFFFSFSFRGIIQIYDGICKQNCNTKKGFTHWWAHGFTDY